MTQEYTVIKSSQFARFEDLVNIALTKGWTLQGGVSIACNANTHETFYSQALVREIAPIPPLS